jgi:hypothetical protein
MTREAFVYALALVAILVIAGWLHGSRPGTARFDALPTAVVRVTPEGQQPTPTLDIAQFDPRLFATVTPTAATLNGAPVSELAPLP